MNDDSMSIDHVQQFLSHFLKMSNNKYLSFALSAFIFALGMTSIAIGFQHEHDECVNNQDVPIMRPGEWVYSFGFLQLVLFLALFCISSWTGPVLISIVVILDALWLIFGLIILSHTMKTCFQKKHVLAIVMTIDLVYIFIGLVVLTLCNCYQNYFEPEDETNSILP